MVEGQRPRTDQVGLLKHPRQYSADVLEGQPNAGFSATVWSTTAIRLQDGRYETRRYGYSCGSNLAPKTPYSPMEPRWARYPMRRLA